MLSRISFFSFAAFAAMSVAAAPSIAAESAEGLWVNRNGWVVETAPCDEGICGEVVAVGGRSENPMRFDTNNTDPALRGRPLCGIQIFAGFAPSGTPGEWEGGWIYNPQNGKTYDAEMKLGEGDTLEVRGYIATPMFGRTTVLNRQAEPVERCSPEDAQQEANAQ